MQTGENEQALRKILDMTRIMSLAILILHFYFYGYAAFEEWQLTSLLTDRFLGIVQNTQLFSFFQLSKLLAMVLLSISLLGVKGRKAEKLSYQVAFAYLFTGLLIYYGSYLVLLLEIKDTQVVMLYMGLVAVGYLLLLAGGTQLSRIIKNKLQNDIFNQQNETFPQEERQLENEYSINLPGLYRLKNKVRQSWVNIINPFRGLLVLGSPGAGKSYFVIRHVITQHIQKGFTMFVYDFKFDDLSRIAYNTWLKHRDRYAIEPQFYIINFDDLSRSHRCNPLDPIAMTDITDAAESARTILLGLNREWIKRQGDFFVESPINFLTAIIWFLRRYQNGEYCTLPHVIELMQVEYDTLFTVLRTEPEIEVLINPFITAYLNGAMEQLEGQIASAKVAMARLASPQLYYVLSGQDFTLDINNPHEPKLVCMGNNPQKIQIYGAVLSLYVTRLVKLVNQKGKQKSSLIFDEFPTIYLSNMDNLLATARSNKVATTLGVQDLSQLRKDYGREQADVLMNITGNIISGQVTGDTAKQLSERFGRIMQDRASYSINSSDTSISRSQQLESAIPPSRIAALSSGEFVGLVADDPNQKIELKAFHCQIQNNHAQLKKEERSYEEIPVIRKLDNATVQKNYSQIKQEVTQLMQAEMDRIINDPALEYLLIKKANY
ncbi:conjugal transfer protein MobC [Adhaeribacter rhizoryzae]|uniref:Type IV secretion system DNA-binding domain-containing protein n=1 Tax=Adhaeribacter rhizoryzae TaxID=2607907 RepID=A0A5M6DKN1_9BACT|nr:conjugal transfer protein MobC [Adhaeribacter rhizoryzae]KAA5548104.1 type IV secretion system DNA-binding domain-containing protein [Adhaeribacter rhizoryzae]